jgi:hypothetical protein
VPAHVTVLYPFLPPDRLDAVVRAAVREAVAAVPAFDLVFGRTRRFGDQVLWLAPQPEAPLQALTAAVWARFPQTPPYGGQFADVVPHLTVTDGQLPEVMDAAAEQVRPWLPITARPRAVRLMVGRREPDTWRTVGEFPLPAGRPPA